MSDPESVIDADVIKDKLDRLLEAVERIEGRQEALQASLDGLARRNDGAWTPVIAKERR